MNLRWCFRWMLAFTLIMVTAACQLRESGRAADVVINDAHGGGSMLAFSPDGRLLASGGWGGRLRLWSLPSGRPAGTWQAHDETVNGAAFVRGGREIVSAGYDGWLRRWNLRGKRLAQRRTPSPVTHMQVDEQADRLLTGHADGFVRLYRLSDFHLLGQRHLHDGAVRAVARHHATGQWASSGHDGRVFVWRELARVRRLPDPPTDARTLAFNPDGRILTGGGWFRLFRWRLADGRLRTLPTPHRGIIQTLQYTADGRGIFTISRQTDSSVLLLDPRSGRLIRRFRQHDLCGGYLRLSPDGHWLATTSDDASVRIWHLKR